MGPLDTPNPACVSETADNARQQRGLRGALVQTQQEREEDGVCVTRQRLLAESEDLEWWSGQDVAVRHG